RKSMLAENAGRSQRLSWHPADSILPYFFAEFIFLRRHNVFQLGLHLNRRKAGRVPAAAQGLDEEHARHQPLSVNHGELLFTVEEILLRVDDIQVTHEATGVAAAGDVQGTSRR